MTRQHTRRLTVPAVDLLLEGTGHRVGQAGRNGSRHYWLESEAGKVDGSEATNLETLVGFIRLKQIA